jgi:hypothetical protein
VPTRSDIYFGGFGDAAFTGATIDFPMRPAAAAREAQHLKSMRIMPRPTTLRLTRPYGRTLLLAAVILVLLVGLLETLSRIDAIRARLPAPSLGSGHQNFDLKLARLEDFIKKEGGVDCILLGPSTVNQDLAPSVIRTAFLRRTGKNIRIFNFGLAGLNNPVAATVMKILVDRFHPRLVILGVFAGEEGFGLSTAQRLMSNPWVNQQLGRPSLNGWLLDRSLAYRYFMRFCIWLKQPEFSRFIRRLEGQTLLDGFTRTTRSKPNIDKPPDPIRAREFFDRFGHFQIAPSHLEALDDMLRFKTRVEMVFLELPIHPTFMSFFGHGKDDYDLAIEEIRKRAQRDHVPYWSASQVRIPISGWRNRNHLNAAGAQILSLWLGDELAEAVKQGRLKNPGGRP